MLILPPPQYRTQIEVASTLAKKELTLDSTLSGVEWVLVFGLGVGITLGCCKLFSDTFSFVFKMNGFARNRNTNSSHRKKWSENKSPQIVTVPNGESGVVVGKLDLGSCGVVFEVTVPKLTPSGQLEFWKTIESVGDLKFPVIRGSRLIRFKQTATLVVERFEITKHLQELESVLQMGHTLQGLIQTSEEYQTKASYLQQVEQQLEIVIADALALLQEQDKLIRESLGNGLDLWK